MSKNLGFSFGGKKSYHSHFTTVESLGIYSASIKIVLKLVDMNLIHHNLLTQQITTNY